MNDIVITAEGLDKKYLIDHQAEGERYTALRDVVARGAHGLVRSAADMLRGRPLIAGDEVEEFWALKDVSFEVKRGEVVGIIGRNGAGKSTLLKILSRITEPSAGRVTIRGRVASLLEVGTGFHPELTGRENIYLNGAILGMTRVEIRKRFDEIVAFAEVEKFLDTPVKRYSSGMYVRLAFAVAAHLEPEILLVDEVLAVGDAEFQRKCLGKMGEVASGGRTVLFVSHNLPAVSGLCNNLIVLANGRTSFHGDPAQGISRYLSHFRSPLLAGSSEYRPPAISGAVARLTSARLMDEQGIPTAVFRQDQEIRLEVAVEVLSAISAFRLCLRVDAAEGTILLTSSPSDLTGVRPIEVGVHVHQCCIPRNFLNRGIFYLTISADVPMQEVLFFHEAVFRVEVLDLGGLQSEIPDNRLGLLRCPLPWREAGATPRPASGNARGHEVCED
jgi:lipopolysaccharide transport system ATP-binding protein